MQQIRSADKSCSVLGRLGEIVRRAGLEAPPRLSPFIALAVRAEIGRQRLALPNLSIVC